MRRSSLVLWAGIRCWILPLRSTVVVSHQVQARAQALSRMSGGPADSSGSQRPTINSTVRLRRQLGHSARFLCCLLTVVDDLSSSKASFRSCCATFAITRFQIDIER
ncbi:hypothetical protein V7S43_017972 [Phytophthora oleae]|uniref:Secreted protein n=1 Tax=Phytophthora oleae TaxID=2107226 RepID=A0ABD3ERT5_9STRA